MHLLQRTLLLQLLILADHYRTSSALLGRVDVVEDSNKNYTFVVAIENKDTGRVVCTGSLITKRHVLTTKHCLQVHPHDQLVVVAGNYDRTKGTKYVIANSTSFHQWSKQQSDVNKDPYVAEDVDVLTLSERVKGVSVARFTDKIGYEFTKSIAVVLGWGLTDNGNQSHRLRLATVELLSKKDCEFFVLVYNGNNTYDLQHDHICSTSSYYERVSSGDEGGPLMFEGEVIGMALHSIIPDDGVDHESEPSLYLSVYYYVDFIRSFVRAEANVEDDYDDDEDEDCEL